MSHNTDNFPDGFYLLTNADGDHPSLVKLYSHPDFTGVRHIAFGPWDGAALMPVWDLREDSVLTPAVISAGTVPTNDLRASPATPAEDAKDAAPEMPEHASEAMLRPFYECPPDELPLAYQAMRQIAMIEQRRATLETQGEKNG